MGISLSRLLSSLRLQRSAVIIGLVGIVLSLILAVVPTSLTHAYGADGIVKITVKIQPPDNAASISVVINRAVNSAVGENSKTLTRVSADTFTGDMKVMNDSCSVGDTKELQFTATVYNSSGGGPTGSINEAIGTSALQQICNNPSSASFTVSIKPVTNDPNSSKGTICGNLTYFDTAEGKAFPYQVNNSNVIAVMEGTGTKTAAVKTDNSGKYCIGNVTPGKYKLTAAYSTTAGVSKDNWTSPVFEVLAGQTVTVNHVETSADDDTSTTTEPVEDCALDGIGWIVCPVAKLIGAIVDGMYTLAEELLIFNIEDPYGNNSVYQVWSNIRNLANILFIIAFFVVIFSQATSMGISAYGIRKMLPRIVVAAILVNVSYYICLFGIDLSNIIGAGIDSILKSALAGVDAKTDPTSWSEVISGVLLVGLGGAAVGGAAVAAGGAAIATAALGAALSFAVVALLAILTTLVILVGRQAFLIILIVLSPLAFVAYILPNTESLFDKWRKMFMTLLIFYPLVSLLFIGSQVAASIMRLGTTSDMIKIFSLGVMAFPLFATPFLLKMSGGILGKIGAVVNNPNRGPFDRMKKAGQERIDNSKMGLLSNAKKQEKAAMRREKSIAGITAKGNKGLRRAEFGKNNKDAMNRAYDNIYDANREQVAKKTERTRGRQTDFGAYTAGSTYKIRDASGQLVDTDKDSFMEHVYGGGKGEVTRLDGGKMDFDGSDSTQKNAIAAQAAKSGDKAMYGKLLSAASKRTRDAKAAYESGPKTKESLEAYQKIAGDEYALRDYGVNNAGTVQGGHPDVVKGKYSAFKAVTAEGLASMDGSAVARMGDYLSDKKNVIADMDIPWTRNAEKEAADAGHVSGTAAHTKFVEDKKNEYAQGYIDTAQASLRTAVQQLNTNPIYGGKVPENGDLGKAIGKAFVGTKGTSYEEGVGGSQGSYQSPAWGEDYKIRDQKPREATQASTTPVNQNEELSDGGLIVPRGTAASQSQSRPAPAPSTPAPQPSPQPGPQPTPTDTPSTSTSQQRQAGGNFGGGFGATQPTTPPATQSGGTTSDTGGYVPNNPDGTPRSADQAADYESRQRGERP